ncbi:HAMP domain-containing sensor histidine kinase [Actinoplanes sp. NPDC051861]|uniref:sensor histidine kinase n=1 Tax=Actinoplanes sp. NPDC051861 TaxID=3155170 RepID=UPI00344630B0
MTVVPLPSLDEPFAGALSRLGHELRGPLSGIAGLTGLMTRKLSQGQADPEQQARQLQMINTSATDLMLTVERVVALARAATSAPGRCDEPIDLTDLARRAVTATRDLAGARGRDVLIDTPAEPVLVLAHRDDALQALTELLDNALRYTDHPDVRLAVRPATVEVSDRGPGLSAEDQRVAFLPFERGSAAGESGAGAGLGLCLAQRLVHRFGGALTMRTSPDGTTCTIAFPPYGEADGHGPGR